MWWDHDFGWTSWILMGLGMAGFWVLVAVLLIAVLRGAGPAMPVAPPTARQVLDQRLARGEIDLDEYRARVSALAEAQERP